MTKRWKNDDDSIGNTTISTITLPENGETLQLLGAKYDDIVGDGGSSDAEGEGEFEVGILKQRSTLQSNGETMTTTMSRKMYKTAMRTGRVVFLVCRRTGNLRLHRNI